MDNVVLSWPVLTSSQETVWSRKEAHTHTNSKYRIPFEYAMSNSLVHQNLHAHADSQAVNLLSSIQHSEQDTFILRSSWVHILVEPDRIAPQVPKCCFHRWAFQVAFNLKKKKAPSHTRLVDPKCVGHFLGSGNPFFFFGGKRPQHPPAARWWPFGLQAINESKRPWRAIRRSALNGRRQKLRWLLSSPNFLWKCRSTEFLGDVCLLDVVIGDSNHEGGHGYLMSLWRCNASYARSIVPQKAWISTWEPGHENIGLRRLFFGIWFLKHFWQNDSHSSWWEIIQDELLVMNLQGCLNFVGFNVFHPTRHCDTCWSWSLGGGRKAVSIWVGWSISGAFGVFQKAKTHAK